MTHDNSIRSGSARAAIEALRASRRRSRPGIDRPAVAEYVRSRLGLRRSRVRFDSVEAYCGFLGCPRSGTTAIESLLSAHRGIVVSNELDALRFVKLGFPRDQLYYLIVSKDAEFTRGGREWSNYNHLIPESWQGRAETLKVIGDKRAPDSLWWLKEDPTLLERLRRTVRVPLRLLHVRRNPFDAIATMSMRSGRSLDNRIDTYFALCDELERAKSHLLAPGELLEVSLEGLIEQPERTLRTLCTFLGVEADGEYLSLCSDKVLDRPHDSRDEVIWSRDQWARVAREMRRFHFLGDYAGTPAPRTWRGGAVGGRGSTQPAPTPARR